MDLLVRSLKDTFFSIQVQAKKTTGQVGPDAQPNPTDNNDDIIDVYEKDAVQRSARKQGVVDILDP